MEVLKISKKLFNARVTHIRVDKYGFIDLQQLKDSITPSTCLVSIMLANNEVGTLNRMENIQKVVNDYNKTSTNKVVFHSDCSQAIGKVRVDAQFCDLMTCAGHKLYAPKGVGFLMKKKHIVLYKLTEGAG